MTVAIILAAIVIGVGAVWLNEVRTSILRNQESYLDIAKADNQARPALDLSRETAEALPENLPDLFRRAAAGEAVHITLQESEYEQLWDGLHSTDRDDPEWGWVRYEGVVYSVLFSVH